LCRGDKLDAVLVLQGPEDIPPSLGDGLQPLTQEKIPRRGRKGDSYGLSLVVKEGERCLLLFGMANDEPKTVVSKNFV